MGNPFYYHGAIRPQNADAWGAMHRQDRTLQGIMAGLRMEPPEYFSIVAPVQGGKTTLALQLMSEIENKHPDMLVVFIDMGLLGKSATEERLVRYILTTFTNRLIEALSPDLIDPSYKADLIAKFHSAAAENFADLMEDLNGLLAALSTHRRVVLLIDEIDLLAQEVRDEFLERLRSMHAMRGTASGMKKLCVGILFTRMPKGVKGRDVSPYNISMPYHIADLTREDLARFFRRCEGALDRVVFTAEAVDYVFQQTAGHMIFVQMICREAIMGKVPPSTVGVTDVLGGIAACFEQPEKFIASLLNVEGLGGEAQITLQDLMCHLPVLPHAYLEHIATLMDRGIIKKSLNNRCDFRSPLLRALFTRRFAKLRDLLGLSLRERWLTELPQVQVLLLNEPLRTAVDERVRPSLGASAGAGPGGAYTYENLAYGALMSMDLGNLLDTPGAQFFYARYFPDQNPGSVDKCALLRVVAQAFASWSEQA